jgi:hypothetical protein
MRLLDFLSFHAPEIRLFAAILGLAIICVIARELVRADERAEAERRLDFQLIFPEEDD